MNNFFVRGIADPAFLGAVSNIINMLEMFDDYEERQEDKKATELTLKTSYKLYQQGKITRDAFLAMVALAVPERHQKRVTQPSGDFAMDQIKSVLEQLM